MSVFQLGAKERQGQPADLVTASLQTYEIRNSDFFQKPEGKTSRLAGFLGLSRLRLEYSKLRALAESEKPQLEKFAASCRRDMSAYFTFDRSGEITGKVGSKTLKTGDLDRIAGMINEIRARTQAEPKSFDAASLVQLKNGIEQLNAGNAEIATKIGELRGRIGSAGDELRKIGR